MNLLNESEMDYAQRLAKAKAVNDQIADRGIRELLAKGFKISVKLLREKLGLSKALANEAFIRFQRAKR